MGRRNLPAVVAILRKYRLEIPPQMILDFADYFEREQESFDRDRFLRAVADLD